jgi:tetratricopeptide (TPR) repeat protein
MIVKDEADQLTDCLKSVQGLVDEICVVDTGSRDNTLEIAKSFKARTSVFIWCDDFAAARNESLRLCTKDWILVLDADERIAPQDVRRLRQLSHGPGDCCYRLTTRNYTNAASVAEFRPCPPGDPFAKGFAGWFPSTKARFFPNRKGAKFEGKIHELVNRSLEQLGLRMTDCDVPVLHYPYTKSLEKVREKQELYLRLGHDKVQSDPKDPTAYVELANQYADVGDYTQAAAHYREALRLDPSNAAILKDLGGMLHLLKRDEESRQALHLALKLNPGLAEAWRNLGVVLADAKDWQGAIECFQQGITNDPLWKEGPRYLSVALEGVNRLAEATVEARKALEALPHSAECLHLYIHQMLRLERRTEARAVLQSLIAGGAGSPELHNAIGELYFYDGMLEESKEYFMRGGEAGLGPAYNNLGVVLFKQGRFGEARTAFENCLRVDPAHRGAQSNLEKAVKRFGAE